MSGMFTLNVTHLHVSLKGVLELYKTLFSVISVVHLIYSCLNYLCYTFQYSVRNAADYGSGFK